ncbi:MAG: hypothetical protein NXH75_05970 [Halobacteriovoraceae bacterium]|nr:hypothetical protein [Halobacteriovoraceae bacterium]
MAQKLIVSLFSCILILSSFGNGLGTYAFEAEGESLVEISTQIESKNSDIPEVWSGENLSQDEVSVHFQIRKLLLYFHGLSHKGSVNPISKNHLSSIQKRGPPKNFL